MPHKPRKRFGQHFLHDPQVIQTIVECIAPRPGDTMIEIGAGMGAITLPLLKQVGTLAVVELDRDLIPRLESSCKNAGVLKLHNEDALKFNFRALAPHRGGLRVVGNLPYNISTPLIFHLLKSADVIADMHFLMQKEVVDRIIAPAGSRDYGRLSVMIQYRCHSERMFHVERGAFHPSPQVDSALVRLIPYQTLPYPVRDEPRFALIVNHAFSQRRKTLRNALDGLLTLEDIRAAGIDSSVRGETLTVEEFVRLSTRPVVADGDLI
jgi:16S rRNA (adenine1518-N6/adenine1519-N6)-dimethyltransferase